MPSPTAGVRDVPVSVQPVTDRVIRRRDVQRRFSGTEHVTASVAVHLPHPVQRVRDMQRRGRRCPTPAHHVSLTSSYEAGRIIGQRGEHRIVVLAEAIRSHSRDGTDLPHPAAPLSPAHPEQLRSMCRRRQRPPAQSWHEGARGLGRRGIAVRFAARHCHGATGTGTGSRNCRARSSLSIWRGHSRERRLT